MVKRFGIVFLILVFSIIYCTYSVVRHLKFETYIFDLGYYDQLIWQVSRGYGLFLSTIEAHTFTDHISPTLFLLAPLYWVWANPIVLLVFQGVFISLGAYPVYKLSFKKTKKLWFSLALSFVYLSFYGLQNAVAYDFHAVALGPTLLAFVIWFYEEKKFKHFWVSLLLFVGLQENFYILTAAYGVFLIVRYKDYRRGLFIALSAASTFLIIIFYTLPAFFGNSYYYLPTHFNLLNFQEIFRALYLPPSKVDVVVYPFIAFGLLPILSPAIFIMLTEEFLGRFLGTTNPNWWILGFHYNAILAPIMALGAMEAFSKYFKKTQKVGILLLMCGLIISQYRVNPDIKKMFNPDFYDFSKTNDRKEIIKLIPENASVAATNDIGAQIAERETLLFLTNCLENTNPRGPDGRRCFTPVPEYIAANLDPSSLNNFYPDYDRESLVRYINAISESGEYELVAQRGDVYLLKRSNTQ